jgi:competence protein ComEC
VLALVVVATGVWARLPVTVARSGAGRTGSAAAQSSAPAPAPLGEPRCGSGRMTVHFYDVGQGLSALVDLPDGRHVLVDTGDNPRRRGCETCSLDAARLLRGLHADLGRSPLDVVWITHQHSDHMGGAPEVLNQFSVGSYVDNGREAHKAEVRAAHLAAQEHGVTVRVVDPEHAATPIASSPTVKVRAVLPAAWPPRCDVDANECSIGLRIDYCSSSILFMGDAEHDEEALLDPGGPVTLLQVAHHGSATSTTPGFLAKAKPSYAVLSAGKPDEGPNRDYCHPRAIVVRRLARVLGGRPSAPLRAFDGERCDRAIASDWISVPTTDRLWATERDGDVVLSTTGDGTFARQ